MKYCLSQVCTLPASFELDIEDFAAGGCQTIEVWLTKLEHFLESHSVEQAIALLEEHNVQLPVASFQGGLLASQGEKRKQHWDHWQHRLNICQQLNIQTIVVACDVPAPAAATDLQRIQESLKQLSRDAEQAQVSVALEFQATAAFGNNLQTAAALITQIPSPFMGLCFDAFHFFVGPSKLSDLEAVDPERLFHVQLCDLLDMPRELATDSDRILPGEGSVPLQDIAQWLKSIDYQRTVSIELMNPQIWQVPPRQFSEVGLAALNQLFER